MNFYFIVRLNIKLIISIDVGELIDESFKYNETEEIYIFTMFIYFSISDRYKIHYFIIDALILKICLVNWNILKIVYQRNRIYIIEKNVA
jgi:hypothetical protein